MRLEELGLFTGQVVTKMGSLGPLGPVYVTVGDSTVALSIETARSVLVEPVGPGVPAR